MQYNWLKILTGMSGLSSSIAKDCSTNLQVSAEIRPFCKRCGMQSQGKFKVLHHWQKWAGRLHRHFNDIF